MENSTNTSSITDELIQSADSIPFGFLVYSQEKDGKILAANQRFLRLCGCSSMEELLAYTNGTSNGLIERRELFAGGDPQEGADLTDMSKLAYFHLIRKDGHEIQVHATGAAMDDPKYGPVCMLYFADRNEQTNRNVYDLVSGLYRKEYLFGLLENQQKNNPAELDSRTWSVIYLNLEGFKAYNDDYGFDAGNLLLHDFGALAQEVFQTQLITRIYADQFAVFYDHRDYVSKINDLHEKAKKLRSTNPVWVKAGVYETSSLSGTVPDLAIDYAKTACDVIPDDGKAFFNIYSQELRNKLERRKYIISHVDEAITKGWIRLYFQPVVRILTEKISSYEALARWVDPVLGMISPGEFVPALEAKNLSWKLAVYVIDATAATLSRMAQEGLDTVPVSINLSRKDFDSIDPFALLEQAVAKYHVPRNLICIEITESTAMQNPERIKQVIGRFHDAGYQVWMDDFGSAYSSLNALKDFDFDEIKLDMVFMSNLNGKSKRIIENCINMAKDIGIQTLCEGVERKEQADFLQACGCEKIQGYYYSHPVSLQELLEKIRNRKFVCETLSESELFDSLGSVRAPQDQASAMILVKDSRYIPLNATKKFRESYRSYGYPEIRLLHPMSLSKTELQQKMQAVMNLAMRSGKQEEYTCFERGHCLILTADVLGRSENETVCVLTVRDITQNAAELKLASTDPILQSILNSYDCIYRILPGSMQKEVVLSNFSRELPGMREDFSPEKMAEPVWWEDRERFLSWFTRENILCALTDGNRRDTSNIFRFTGSCGSYSWKVICIMKIGENPGQELLYTVRPSVYSNADLGISIAKAFLSDHPEQKTDDVFSPAVLWRALLSDEGNVFCWKDKEGRYLGASNGFFAASGISASGLIGKKDTDLGWHTDDAAFEKMESEVLTEGKAEHDVPQDFIHRSRKETYRVSVFPIYRNGKPEGLIEWLSGSAVQKSSREVPSDGLMPMGEWLSAISEYEDQYSSENRPYCFGILVLGDYWKIRHEFGEETAEALEQNAAACMADCAGTSSLICRIDRETFAFLSHDRTPADLDVRLEGIRENLLRIRTSGRFRGGIFSRIGAAGRSEALDSFRTIALAMSRAEKADVSYENQLEQTMNTKLYGQTLSPRSRMTKDELHERTLDLLSAFDIVRTINPVTKRVILYRDDGNVEYAADSCFEIWGTGKSCENCISMKALVQKTTIAKLEPLGDNLFVEISQYIEVDGKPCILEMLKHMEPDSYLSDDEKTTLLHSLKCSRMRVYEDRITGAHNRKYYDEVLANQVASCAALVELSNLGELKDQYGMAASEAIIRREVEAILTCVRSNDLVLMRDRTVLVTFAQITQKIFESRLDLIRKSILSVQMENYPDLALLPLLGGVYGRGHVQDLLPYAETALKKAENEPRHTHIDVLNE